jgi:dihydrofolate reductase
MGIVQAQAIMSLDGYVAKQDNTIGRLFDWLQNGEVAIPTPAGDFAVHLTPPSSEHWQRWVPSLGALVCGRTLFDVTNGWHGRHTLDVPVVVVTHQVPKDWADAHPGAPFSFVTDGVEAAIARAQELTGDKVAAVTGGTIARQCLAGGRWCSTRAGADAADRRGCWRLLMLGRGAGRAAWRGRTRGAVRVSGAGNAAPGR